MGALHRAVHRLQQTDHAGEAEEDGLQQRPLPRGALVGGPRGGHAIAHRLVHLAQHAHFVLVRRAFGRDPNLVQLLQLRPDHVDQVLEQQELLDLVGPLVDRHHPGIAPVLLDTIALQLSVDSVYRLQEVEHAMQPVGAEQLGDR